MPENIGNDTLFMFLSLYIGKILAELDFQVPMAAILDLSDVKCNIWKNTPRIGFLMPEKIGNDRNIHIFNTLFGKILAALNFQVQMAAILDLSDHKCNSWKNTHRIGFLMP